MAVPPPQKGRGAAANPPNQFQRLHVEPDLSILDDEEPRRTETRFLRDASKSVLAANDSPDIPFRYSINPYRGCEHGCAYCYARPSHEYLGFSAGIDFETRILVKEDAPALLAAAFQKKSWEPQPVIVSGNTDPYQPVERQLKLTRRCLEVFLEHRNPVGIITKNALVTRDLDILSELAALDLVAVRISITSLRDDVINVMEPRTSRPARRLKAVARLAEAGVPVGVMVAPIIPGLTDEEIPAILEAAAGAGATSAGYTVVRLPGAVEPVFTEWVERAFPERAGKILNRIRELRGGRLSDPRFGTRQRGEGIWAETISKLFRTNCERLGLNASREVLATHHFRRLRGGQMDLF
jgi:DNA repair photolyase